MKKLLALLVLFAVGISADPRLNQLITITSGTPIHYRNSICTPAKFSFRWRPAERDWAMYALESRSARRHRRVAAGPGNYQPNYRQQVRRHRGDSMQTKHHQREVLELT